MIPSEKILWKASLFFADSTIFTSELLENLESVDFPNDTEKVRTDLRISTKSNNSTKPANFETPNIRFSMSQLIVWDFTSTSESPFLWQRLKAGLVANP